MTSLQILHRHSLKPVKRAGMSPYIAPGVFRNGHVNSIMSVSPARKLLLNRQCRDFRRAATPVIIPAQHNIRLSALINRQPGKADTVLLMHGWLGCADSLYLISLGQALFQAGYHVVRLNFRDHGNSHHLNAQLFHSCRIQEVINACISIQDQFQSDLSLIGFSLGGNFALRVNAYTQRSELDLHRTIAICPVIDPDNTLSALENSMPVYAHYFMQRWKKTFYAKAQAFPALYAKASFDEAHDLRTATANLATQYAGFSDLDSYLQGYSICGQRLSTLQAEAITLLAEDDPIIPWQDKDKIYPADNHQILTSQYGGHCGFLDHSLNSTWIDRLIVEHLQ